MRLFKLLFLLLIMYSPLSEGYDFKLALLHGDKDVFSYELSVLRLALAHAEGEHTLEVVPVLDANQARILNTLKSGKGSFNIFFSGFSKERERQLLQVDFPLSRGLLGYRVFIIHKDNKNKMAAITSLEEMKQNISIGSGVGWPDTDIFRLNGFEVHESSYDNLWKMLNAKRFTAFNRGVNEAFVEIGQQQQVYENFVVDRSLMVVYPFDYFFYLSPRTPELRDVVMEGLENAFKSGEFAKNFNAHPQIKLMLKQLKPQKRISFRLENPLLSDRIKNIPEEFWYRLD